MFTERSDKLLERAYNHIVEYKATHRGDHPPYVSFTIREWFTLAGDNRDIPRWFEPGIVPDYTLLSTPIMLVEE